MKRFIFSGLLLMTTVAIQAQNFTLGLKTGVNLATLKGDIRDESNRMGYQAGAWARVRGAGFYVQPEVYLGSKGAAFGSISQNGTTYRGNGEINFTVLDVPVLIGRKFGFEKFNFRIMTGPVVSFLLNQSTKENFEIATNFENYRNLTIGLQSGAGIDLGSLSVDLRYEKGLSNIDKSGQYDQKQNLWHLSLGYRIF